MYRAHLRDFPKRGHRQREPFAAQPENDDGVRIKFLDRLGWEK